MNTSRSPKIGMLLLAACMLAISLPALQALRGRGQVGMVQFTENPEVCAHLTTSGR